MLVQLNLRRPSELKNPAFTIETNVEGAIEGPGSTTLRQPDILCRIIRYSMENTRSEYAIPFGIK